MAKYYQFTRVLELGLLPLPTHEVMIDHLQDKKITFGV